MTTKLKPISIAIDGPVAVGKSTVGRLLAERLGFCFIDTGSMYRALTWKAIREGIDLEDEERLKELAMRSKMEFVSGCLLLDGEDINKELRSPEVERGVSLVSKLGGVREILVSQQRALAEGGGVVMAGRDIGTVVLPHAELKIFLTASLRERAYRRFKEVGGDFKTILEELERRDRIDSQREISPLKPAPDAYIIDTENLSPEEVVDKILSLLRGV